MEHCFFNNSQILSPTGLRLKQIPCSMSRRTAPSCEDVSRTPGAIVNSVIVAGSLMLPPCDKAVSVPSSDTIHNSLGFWTPAKNYFCCKNLCSPEPRRDGFHGIWSPADLETSLAPARIRATRPQKRRGQPSAEFLIEEPLLL